MNRKYSLKRSKDIDRVFHLKNSVGTKYYTAYFAPSPQANPRIAISISKRCGNAPLRNYEKRVLRELLRPHLTKMKNGDYLFIIKQQATTITYQAKQEQIDYLTQKLMKNKEN
jgi:ribonuclease P protein component